MPERHKIPGALLRYVPIAEAFDRLGQRRYGEDWTGGEISTPKTCPPARARELKSELERKHRMLKDKVRQSGREYVEECIRLNEVTGYLDEDLLDHPELKHDDTVLYNLIYRLNCLHSYFDTCPDPDDEIAYEIQYQS